MLFSFESRARFIGIQLFRSVKIDFDNVPEVYEGEVNLGGGEELGGEQLPANVSLRKLLDVIPEVIHYYSYSRT